MSSLSLDLIFGPALSVASAASNSPQDHSCFRHRGETSLPSAVRFTKGKLMVPNSASQCIGPRDLAQWLADDGWHAELVVIDVRELHEVRRARLAGAIHIPLGQLAESVIARVPDLATRVVVYCESGMRSERAARLLLSLGYSRVGSLESGIAGWKKLGLPLDVGDGGALLEAGQQDRYSRHLQLPGFTERHQRKLLESRVLVLGLGGLGCPAALYLAAAGVGCLGLLDNDRVELSNLQRQILHATSRVGVSKVESAASQLMDLNGDTRTLRFETRLDVGNVDEIFAQEWDVIVDGCDNFSTRYLINDASHRYAIPVVHGSVSRFEGRVTTFIPRLGPCYRCLFPNPPPEGLCLSCDAAGVLGVLPGLIGVMQATEALKILLGLGEPLLGRLLTYDALSMEFRSLRFERAANCRVCAGPVTEATRT
jgi:molybdopterin/thiamine biosynthesis adenylyltransferase/rhodanese-related sulfurtransferase